MEKYLKISGLMLILIVLFYSCNQEQKNFNQARNSQATEELKSFITNYPNSIYVDSANILIEKLIWQETILENSDNSYEAYLTNYPNGQYVDEVREQLEKKKKNLKLALDAFNLAQQTNVKSEREELFSKTDSLFKLANFPEFILKVYKDPSINLHIDESGSFSELIERPLTLSRYLYGGSAYENYLYITKNEKINEIISYSLILASANVTHIKISLQLMRDGRVISNLGENVFSVRSKQYSSYIGFFHSDSVNTLPNDQLRFVINASGSDFGKSCGNYETYIKAVRPLNTLNTTTLTERVNAIKWCVSNSKWSHPGAHLIDFIAQLDYCVLNGKNGKWDIGGGSQKDGQPYQVSWNNNTLTVEKLTTEKADSIGIKEYSMSFSIE